MKNTKEKAETKAIKLNIKRIAKEKNIKVAELCRRLGYNRTYLAHLTNPSLQSIVAIAQAIGCSPAELLEGL